MSIYHRIVGPIALLILIGVATTAWITQEAVRTHEESLQHEIQAQHYLTSIKRAQDAHLELEEYISSIMRYDDIVPKIEVEHRFQELTSNLLSEIANFGKMDYAPELASSVAEIETDIARWYDASKIALGLVANSAVPTHHHLTGLAQETMAALESINSAASVGVAGQLELERSLFKSKALKLFISMCALFGVLGVFFIGFGRSLAGTLARLAVSMGRIQNGNFSTKVSIDTRMNNGEVGQIALGVEAFRETLRALTDANQEVQHLAMHDPLTGLSNRRALQAFLSGALEGSDYDISRIAVLNIDLDRFKQINDLLGHTAGDEVLIHAARSMVDETRACDFVSRVGGDEFVIILCDVKSQKAVIEIANRLIASIAEPVEVGGELATAGASIGIAFASARENDAELLLNNADMALYIAKGAGRGRYSLFSHETRKNFETDMILLRDLRVGLEHGQIFPFFQPQLNALTGDVIGFEALARWDHPKRGVLSPIAFIDLAFKNGLGDRLTDVIIRGAIAALLEWRALGYLVPCVSVNFAASQLRDAELTERLDDTLFAAGLQPKDLVIEVLESVLLGDDVDPARLTIAQLKRSGYRIELDDFGTGHASISNLCNFKVDGIKLDRIFVSGVEMGSEQEMILRTLIDLCHNLKIDCLAEGVETEEEKSVLLTLGCSRFQGYGVALPMPQGSVIQWLSEIENLRFVVPQAAVLS